MLTIDIVSYITTHAILYYYTSANESGPPEHFSVFDVHEYILTCLYQDTKNNYIITFLIYTHLLFFYHLSNLFKFQVW